MLTKIQMIDVRNAIRVMVAQKGIENRLHSETLQDVRQMSSMSADKLIDLHWEVYHQIND
jgi:hypothetical protein